MEGRGMPNWHASPPPLLQANEGRSPSLHTHDHHRPPLPQILPILSLSAHSYIQRRCVSAGHPFTNGEKRRLDQMTQHYGQGGSQRENGAVEDGGPNISSSFLRPADFATGPCKERFRFLLKNRNIQDMGHPVGCVGRTESHVQYTSYKRKRKRRDVLFA